MTGADGAPVVRVEHLDETALVRVSVTCPDCQGEGRLPSPEWQRYQEDVRLAEAKARRDGRDSADLLREMGAEHPGAEAAEIECPECDELCRREAWLPLDQLAASVEAQLRPLLARRSPASTVAAPSPAMFEEIRTAIALELVLRDVVDAWEKDDSAEFDCFIDQARRVLERAERRWEACG